MTAHNTARILILDDERCIVDTLCEILKQLGYESRGAYTHSTALSAAHEFQPNVFLTGFNNVGKNGCETAIDILTFLPQCRVIIFSGCASTADALPYYRQRGLQFEVLSKPVHVHDLLALLRSSPESPAHSSPP
jgi:DNA-binding NtrC family response regulator